MKKKVEFSKANLRLSLPSQLAEGMEDELSFEDIVVFLWRGKLIIAIFVVLFTLGGVILSLYLPNLYKSEVVLAPVEDNSNRWDSRIGGLASLAGVELGGNTGSVEVSVEILKSRDFILGFIYKRGVVAEVAAATRWRSAQNALEYDSQIYDSSSNRFVNGEPSRETLIMRFKEILTVKSDKATGFVTVGVEFFSPHIAKRWAGWLVEEINLNMRARDVQDAKKNISYLTSTLDQVVISDVRSIFYGLIEEQTKVLMFAEGRDEYIFKVIDSAYTPEIKSKPRRAIICVLSCIVGGILGVLVVFLKELWFRVKLNLSA